MEETHMEIDDSLYSRQRYVLGDSAMHKMARSTVFISGIGGLGVEIAKNVVLAGVKEVVIHDSQPATVSDLGSQFFLRDTDVRSSTSRAEASLSRLAELNPYVTVSLSTLDLTVNSDLSPLSQYQCVILTDCDLELQKTVDRFCHSHTPPIMFISCSVRGVFSSLFCDCGPEFTVVDPTGEEPAQSFIASISQANPGVVSCQEGQLHGLVTGDHVEFREVVGMETLNGKTFPVKVVSPSQFAISCDTSGPDFTPYQHGGIARQVKVPKTLTFESLESQLRTPDCLLVDFAKMEAPSQLHTAFMALHQFSLSHDGELPRARSEADAEALVQLAKQVNSNLKLVEEVDEGVVRWLALTARGCLPPLVTVIGGFAAQEAIISLTGKFSPLQQWLYLDAVELLSGQEKLDPQTFMPRGDRYDALRICIGQEMVEKLANLRLFMVGCGAIGCEMLKNYAMLGVGRRPNGMVTITDNDLIEKSNLNRQFLFRPHHIQKPKSVVAAKSTLEINPDLCIEAQESKVHPATEDKVYNDEFFSRQDLVVNALDNVEARRYVDSRCVSNRRPLLESGTMGAKGHVQVIVPHLTESYSSQQDPPDMDVPYCTLKSFPATIEHTIQWARDKFESLYTQKPAMFNKFWSIHSNPRKALLHLTEKFIPDGMVKVTKMLDRRPPDWASCMALARVKFEKYFNHKARNLLHAFPLNTKMKDGSLFWQSPKRPPTPLDFDPTNQLHLMFVASMARLYAGVCGVAYTEQDCSPAFVTSVLLSISVPQWRPSSKRIETDVSAKKPENEDLSTDVLTLCQRQLEKRVASGDTPPELLTMAPQHFEKDDDSNGHIDFITAASNLRASMYSIEAVDRYRTKLLAGRIVPSHCYYHSHCRWTGKYRTAEGGGWASIGEPQECLPQPRSSYPRLL
ncbi:Ubiquitin-like modifier-activating enzyme 6 [Geodia barretti]|uniref:E1 ubiquitin-activating enzyme n=2 Tax=Geodia barretti TaxID=519541 RepID=A0AA35TQB9_GEOBA|nr:Ubiquitin-like modifier-activating enzyme 6 [Geodia barretti]